MANPVEEDIRARAIEWHLRLNAGDDADWDGFSAWLQADARHNDVYEAVSDADLALDPVMALARADAPPEAETLPSVSTPTRWRWKWPAMAASIALVAAGGWATVTGFGQQYSVVTAPGEPRTVVLADGSRIMLNGGTEIVLRKSDPRVAELRSGEAQFAVRHDDQRPFALTVGNQRIVDIGTVFNVRSSSGGLHVEVAEGAVRYEDGATRLRLNAGDVLHVSGDRLVEDQRPADDIGAWTRGKLVYRDAALIEVAADITRSRGIAIELGPELSQIRFTGVIQLDGDNATLRRRVEALIGAKVAETGDGWSITR